MCCMHATQQQAQWARGCWWSPSLARVCLLQLLTPAVALLLCHRHSHLLPCMHACMTGSCCCHPACNPLAAAAAACYSEHPHLGKDPSLASPAGYQEHLDVGRVRAAAGVAHRYTPGNSAVEQGCQLLLCPSCLVGSRPSVLGVSSTQATRTLQRGVLPLFHSAAADGLGGTGKGPVHQRKWAWRTRWAAAAPSTSCQAMGWKLWPQTWVARRGYGDAGRCCCCCIAKPAQRNPLRRARVSTACLPRHTSRWQAHSEGRQHAHTPQKKRPG